MKKVDTPLPFRSSQKEEVASSAPSANCKSRVEGKIEVLSSAKTKKKREILIGQLTRSGIFG